MTQPTRIQQPWGTRTPYGPGEDWPSRVDEHYADGVSAEQVERWVPAASLLHSNGDAMDIAVLDGQIVGVRGKAGDRVNRGRLDVKDLYGWQANRSPDRLTAPLIREGSKLVPTDWDTAMTAVPNSCWSRTGRARSASTPRVSCFARSTTRWPPSPERAWAPTTWTATPGSAPPPLARR
jgi:anaerobic selenocysteine-containing dehydrogenase